MKLKNTLVVALTVCITLSVTSCSTTVSTRRTSSARAKSLPPGQAKKLNGDKSARNYAPGHNKG